MKLLLINPYLTTLPDDPALPNPSLSIAYLAAYVEPHHTVRVADASAEGRYNVAQVGEKKRVGLSPEQITDIIAEFKPDVLGVTNPSTLHAQDAYDMARLAKAVDPGILVVLGGAHASSNPELVLEVPEVDMAVVGEGEATLLDILDRRAAGQPLDAVPGTCVRGPEGFRRNEPRGYIKDLDAIPLPARHLLPMEAYFEGYLEGAFYAMRKRIATMISSRGCPGECIYCAVKTVWGRRWRGRSPVNVVDEIEHLVKEYGVGEINFLDDSISVRKDRLMGICDEIIRRKLDVRWTTPNGIALWFLDKPLIKRMKQAGCYRLTFGIESGNPDTLRYLGKKYDYGHAKEIIRYSHQVGLWTIGTFIIGSPEETRASIEDSVAFALDSYLDFAVFYIANPFPGTRMYQIYQELGLLDGKCPDEIVRGVSTLHFSHEELVALQGEAFHRFMKSRLQRPWRALTKVRSLEDLSYALRLGGKLFKMVVADRFAKRGIAALWK